jgi:hypothetical protein
MRNIVSITVALTLSLFWCVRTFASPLTTGVSFKQVDFTYQNAPEPDSQYGQIFLDYGVIHQIPGISPSGYVNVITLGTCVEGLNAGALCTSNSACPDSICSTGWVVQNMPVFASSGLPGLSMMFDLGFSGPQTTSFRAIVDYSPSPLADDSTIAVPPDEFDFVAQDFGTLAHVEHNAAGSGDPATAPPGNPTGKMTTTFDPKGATSVPVINTTMRSVEQDLFQCGPGAVANSLAYLNAHYGVPLAHAHVPGRSGAPANSLVGQIDLKVPRSICTGVFRGNMLDGKLRYLDAFGPHGLIIKHQGTFDLIGGTEFIDEDLTRGNETSKYQGGLVALQFLMDEIHHGEDVEMDLRWSSGGGHQIMITGGDTILGRPYVTFIHDAHQNPEKTTDPDCGPNANWQADTIGTGLFDGGYGFAWLDDPGGGARIKFKGYIVGDDGLNAEVRNIVTESVKTCAFDTNGDGKPDLQLFDTNGNGLCEWPQRTTTIVGTLNFTAATPVEFIGNTSVYADRIVVHDGALLKGDAASLVKLTLVARSSTDGDIVSNGTLDISASDDIILQSKRSIDLSEGATNLHAGDKLVLKASTGDVTVAPAIFDANGPFTLFARNRVEINARGANGSIDIARARVGSFRIVVNTKASVSVVGDKHLRLSDHTLLTTDATKVGIPNSSNIDLTATGRVSLTDDTTLDSGRKILVTTSRTVDDVCLTQSTTIEAANGFGRISFAGVKGTVFDDGTTTFVGAILGDRIVPGSCP